jgi:hypothetical protein
MKCTQTLAIFSCLFRVQLWTMVFCEANYGPKSSEQGFRLRLRGGSSVRAHNLSSGLGISQCIPASTMHTNRSEPLNTQPGHSTKRRRPDVDCQESIPPAQLDFDSTIPSAKKNENGEIYYEVTSRLYNNLWVNASQLVRCII